MNSQIGQTSLPLSLELNTEQRDKMPHDDPSPSFLPRLCLIPTFFLLLQALKSRQNNKRWSAPGCQYCTLHTGESSPSIWRSLSYRQISRRASSDSGRSGAATSLWLFSGLSAVPLLLPSPACTDPSVLLLLVFLTSCSLPSGTAWCFSLTAGCGVEDQIFDECYYVKCLLL